MGWDLYQHENSVGTSINILTFEKIIKTPLTSKTLQALQKFKTTPWTLQKIMKTMLAFPKIRKTLWTLQKIMKTQGNSIGPI
jgi:hypothetical protein